MHKANHVTVSPDTLMTLLDILHKINTKTLCNLTIDKLPGVWYNKVTK